MCFYVSGSPLVWMTIFQAETRYLRQRGLICTLPLCLWDDKLWTMRSQFLFRFHFTHVCGKAESSSERIEANLGSTMSQCWCSYRAEKFTVSICQETVFPASWYSSPFTDSSSEHQKWWESFAWPISYGSKASSQRCPCTSPAYCNFHCCWSRLSRGQ